MKKDYRAYIESIERQSLSQFAVLSQNTRGRQRPIAPCPMRTEFCRDRDRIIHSKAFRRLKHKTQVFLSPEGDHYRTRLTHTLEVTQIARSIARALRLNEDLTEAIALGHDLGHTPFGHAGENALRAFVPFNHNEQSLRVVDVLENDGEGMNLTYEVRDGILHHTSKGTPCTCEGQVVQWSDRIAYINHDIDDAIRAGVIAESDIPAEFVTLFGDRSTNRINSMVLDIVTNSFDKPKVSPSALFVQKIGELRQFMFDRVYSSKAEEYKAIEMLRFLYTHYHSHPELLPDILARMDSTLEQKVCDHIASMTDNYAVKTFLDITVPKPNQ